MRPIYLFLRITLPYAFSIFYRRRGTINKSKKFYAQTIFVSNHPSAFIDPLVVANFQYPIIHFMTRSDVFKWWLKPVTWACHMVPIYRAEQDGAGTYDKNQDVFVNIRKVLQKKRSIILFGEGYTDNVFIRSLKPMKKGASRIGISTMAATNWELDIKVVPVGINYTDPSKFRGDCLVSFGEPIYLKDYKEIYDENPSKAILALMREIGSGIQQNITYVEDKKKADFFEEVLILSRKGMNHVHYDSTYSLEDRFRYSRALAQRFNEEYEDESKGWQELEKMSSEYFEEVENKGAIDDEVISYKRRGNSRKIAMSWLYLILMFPVFIFTAVHSAIPYLFTKLLVEKMFKRKVFWSGVKMVLGGLFWVLYTLPIFWLFPKYIYPDIIPIDNQWIYLMITWVYFFTVPATAFVIFHAWLRKLKRIIKFGNLPDKVLQDLGKKREPLEAKLKEMGI